MLFPSPLRIRRVCCTRDDQDALARHLIAHHAESGLEGSPHFTVEPLQAFQTVRFHLEARLCRSLDEPLWGRAWVLVGPEESSVVGHLELRGGRLLTELHRATLGMGIRRAFTAQGYGPKLLETAVEWARGVPQLDWLDLGVFASNQPARTLYQRMGFVETGRREDAFRLDAGLSMDEVQMTLRLRP